MLRRAFALTTAQRYLVMAINFVTLVALSRLLTPREVGTFAVGNAIALMAISAREFASPNFFVQREALTPVDVRAGFTAMLVLTAAIVAGLALSAPLIAWAFGDAALCPYLWVVCAALLLEVVSQTIVALMQRDMAFDRMALTVGASQLIEAGLIIGFAALGLGAMSFAWGWLAMAVVSGLLAVCLRPDLQVLRPSFRGWQPMLAFGGYQGVIVVLQRAYEQLPYLVLGRVLSMGEAGLYNRAASLAQLPQKMVLSSVFTLMFPVMSAQVRAGLSVKEPYLKAVAYITAAQWPALVLLAILTEPAVRLLFGSQWMGVVPVVQILALAALFAPCAELNTAALTSVGAINDLMWRSLLAIPLAGIGLCASAGLGLRAMALSFLITVPFSEGLILHAVQRRVGFAWLELGAVLARSATVTAWSAAGPLAVVAAAGLRLDLSLPMAILAGILGAAGWLWGLWRTRHPLAEELHHLAALVGGERLAGRAMGLALGMRRVLAWRR